MGRLGEVSEFSKGKATISVGVNAADNLDKLGLKGVSTVSSKE